MEAKNHEAGELIYEEAARGPSINRKAIGAILAGGWVAFLLVAGLLICTIPTAESLAMAIVVLILALASATVFAYLILILRPLRLYERGLTTRSGKFVPYEKLNRVHMSVMRPPYGCQIWFSKSLSRGPMLFFHLKQDEVDAYRHIELARRLEDLGLVVSAQRHPKAEDDGLVEMTRGALLLEEPPEVFSAWWKRTLIAVESFWAMPLLVTITMFVHIELEMDGTLGRFTAFFGPLVLAFGALVAVTIFFALPRDGWRFYERGLAIRVFTDQRQNVRYEDCAYAVLRHPWPFRTGTLRLYLKGRGIAGTILVGEKKHAYGDIDRLVELLESKGVPVER